MLWTRGELKSKAKDVLRMTYWPSLLVSLLILITSGGNGSSGGSNSGWRESGGSSLPTGWLMIIILIVIGIAIVALAIVLLVGCALEVGGRRYYLDASETKKANLSLLSYGFKNGYFNIIITYIIRGLWIFLGLILFIIPGIIWYYSYRMVPYILADNPKMSQVEPYNLVRK